MLWSRLLTSISLIAIIQDRHAKVSELIQVLNFIWRATQKCFADGGRGNGDGEGDDDDASDFEFDNPYAPFDSRHAIFQRSCDFWKKHESGLFFALSITESITLPVLMNFSGCATDILKRFADAAIIAQANDDYGMNEDGSTLSEKVSGAVGLLLRVFLFLSL